jgi:phosphate transport system substrate-binding protein
MKKIALFAVVLALLGLLSSCGKSESQIKIKGSDTELSLVSAFAEAFMKKNPNVSISVTGGGSGTGIAALLNGQIQVANASRVMKGKEIAQAKKKGIEPTWVIIATDGVAVIVHKDNKVQKLTVAEIAAIFKGEITNWKEVGGDDMAITGYGRQSNSGTFEFVKEKVLEGKDFGASIRRMNGNSQIVKSVETDKSGIGYVGVGYVVPAVAPLAVAAAKGAAYVTPNGVDIFSGKYPLTRPLNQYVAGKPQGVLLDFLKFCVNSEEAAAIVKKHHFFAVQPKYKQINEASGL